MSEVDQEKTELRKLRMQFGNNENADRMAVTLRKLQRAYEEGLAISKRRGTRDYVDFESDEDWKYKMYYKYELIFYCKKNKWNLNWNSGVTDYATFD